MTKIYEKVSENFLELASLQRLNILFKLLERNRKRIEPLAKELDATKQEVHRNLVRLEQSGFLDYSSIGGIPNNQATNYTGDVKFVMPACTSADSATITCEWLKNY